MTLAFTDIEGSTRLLRSLGDDYGTVLRAHRAIVREAVARHGGVEFGTEGDACFLAFPEAGAALAAAAEAQVGLAAADWPGGAAPRVRIGIHTGSPVVVDDDYVGIDVHRAATPCATSGITGSRTSTGPSTCTSWWRPGWPRTSRRRGACRRPRTCPPSRPRSWAATPSWARPASCWPGRGCGC